MQSVVKNRVIRDLQLERNPDEAAYRRRAGQLFASVPLADRGRSNTQLRQTF